jgi:hypothetical protein
VLVVVQFSVICKVVYIHVTRLSICQTRCASTHSQAMPSHYPPHVRWAKPLINSVSRKPTRLEYLRMNLLESHVERCATCEPLLYHRKTRFCRRGCLLEGLVIRDLTVKENGRIYSTERERGYPVRVEVPYQYWAVTALLEQVDCCCVHGR